MLAEVPSDVSPPEGALTADREKLTHTVNQTSVPYLGRGWCFFEFWAAHQANRIVNSTNQEVVAVLEALLVEKDHTTLRGRIP